MKAVILAGGGGTRLRPYTTIIPKPLMPVGDRPILEFIIGQLKSAGLKDIIIAVGYIGELIMSFFGDGTKFGVNIKYFKEDKPLGTAGVLGLIKGELTDAFLMINGDTLTTLSFSDLINYHQGNGAIGTIALKKRGVYLDFGIVELDSSGSIRGYTEKPTIEYLVSMGAYVLESRVLKYVKVGEKLDFPDLIKTLISSGERVNGFVFDGYWLDIGRAEDYKKANDEIGEMLPKLLRPLDGKSNV